MNRFLAYLLILLLLVAGPARGQSSELVMGPPAPATYTTGLPSGVSSASAPSSLELQGPGTPAAMLGALGADTEEGGMSTAIEIAMILTVLSVLPALLITVTCFTRIVIVLSFVRRAMAINELPPNPVLIGLALFLTSFVMGPIINNIYGAAWVPYQAQELTAAEAGDVAWEELSGFLLANTRQSEVELFERIALGTAYAGELPASELPTPTAGTAADARAEGAEAPPMRVVIPAFILSELKTAFQMGFLLFLPFLVIDLVVASVLLSMGMFMLPPAMISTPFKILLFVLVDGWHLVVSSLVTSFVA